jgi:hypothetical protein
MSKGGDAKDFFNKVANYFKEAFLWQLVVRQKFGATVFNVPVIIMILVILIVPHLVLIATLIALIVGYRMAFERRK